MLKNYIATLVIWQIKILEMHPNNKHQANYNIPKLVAVNPVLKAYVFTNKHQTQTIDFSNPQAVKALNKALLKAHYNISYWHFSDKNLCPPIPSRADYLHYLNDLFSNKKKKRTILDIGTGATCIYPILGNALFNWQFVGTDIDSNSLKNAQLIIDKNRLNNIIQLRVQKDKTQVLKGIFTSNDFFDAVMCNPPFYKSLDEANNANKRKQQNLNITSKERNFSGNNNELWYKGGEKAFLHNYLYESSLFKLQCNWFTSLVSKKENIKRMYSSLKKLNATEIKTITMQHGNKITRIVAWRFN